MEPIAEDDKTQEAVEQTKHEYDSVAAQYSKMAARSFREQLGRMLVPDNKRMENRVLVGFERERKAQELEASGKKVSGGLHKFDASEVDINGGSGTADDFMDAFGF